MRCLVPQLAWWLDTSPLFSADFQPKNDDGVLRMATCGTDTHVRIWWLRLHGTHTTTTPATTTTTTVTRVESEDSSSDKQEVSRKNRNKIEIELRADLTRHQRTVSIVRFSHSGEILASGDDEANIILWRLQNPLPDGAPQLFDASDNKENWQLFKVLRGHIEDICDLQWSPRDSCLVSGSIDSSTILWDVSAGRSLGLFKDRKGFVQGVAYDPRGRFVAALSSNRQMYIYSTETRKKVWVASKADIPPPMGDGDTTTTRLFHDDTLKSFCRRPDFSPDGEFLVAPSGVIERDGKISNCLYIFHRSDFAKPIALIPTDSKVTTVVRFSTKFYALRSAKGSSVVSLPYRMVFAAATISSVLVCDTETFTPFAVISDAHYARISDLAWSPDNRTLIASSTDGFCSFILFEEFELGERYEGDLPHVDIVEKAVAKRKRSRAAVKKQDGSAEPAADERAPPESAEVDDSKDASDQDDAEEADEGDDEMAMAQDDEDDDDVENVNLDETQNSANGNDSEESATPTQSPSKEKENKVAASADDKVIVADQKQTTKVVVDAGTSGRQNGQEHPAATSNTQQGPPESGNKVKKRATLTTLGPPLSFKQ